MLSPKNKPSAKFGLILLAVLVVAAAAAAQTSGQPAKRPISLDDLFKIKSVGDPQRSPDGKWVAYTVGTTDIEKDKRNTDLWMIAWDGSEEVRLTSSPDGESTPRWSPDGRYLAFLASRGTDEEKKLGAQVWLLDRRGGEAEKLTDIKGGVGDYTWSPDSRRLAIVSSDQDPADEPEKMEGWKRKTAPPIVIDRYHFKRDREGYLKRFYEHLWLFDVASRKAEPLTSGPSNDASPVWSPDGSRIAFLSARGPNLDRDPDSDLFVIEAKPGAAPIQLTNYPGPDGGRPSWSPDGQWIAFLRGDEPRFSGYNLDKLAVVAAAGGPAKILTETLDRAVSGPICWSADGKSLTFLVEDDRTVYVGRMPAAGGPVEKLTQGRRTVSNVSLGPDGAITLLAGSATEVAEVTALEDGRLRRLTHQNDALFAGLELGDHRGLHLEKQGRHYRQRPHREAGLLCPGDALSAAPPHPRRARTARTSTASDFERELFAANGYVVLAVNYRGSSGRGSAFQKAIFADWGHKEVIDLLGAVDQAVAMKASPIRPGSASAAGATAGS